jgi:small basic protein
MSSDRKRKGGSEAVPTAKPKKSQQEIQAAQNRKKQALVDAVVEAVDLTFQEADNVVEDLLDAKVALSGVQVNSILASFLIYQDEVQCVQLYGAGHGHKYFQDFGARIPWTSINQLHSRGLGQHFHHTYLERGGFNKDVDQQLYDLFCNYFQKLSFGDIRYSHSLYTAKLKKRIRSNRLVVMTGTGVSKGLVNSEKLTWIGLLNEIRALLFKRDHQCFIPDADWNRSSEIKKAELLKMVAFDRFRYLDYRQFVSIVMRDIPDPVRNHDLAVAIKQLELPIATTNYDLLLEHSLDRFEADLTRIPVRMSVENHKEFVYHVHGVWFDSDSVILSDTEYEKSQYDFEYAIGKLFYSSAVPGEHRSLLFVGTKAGMIDSHFSSLYVNPRFGCLEHFALLVEDDLRDLVGNPAFNRAVASGRLFPICYGKQHSDLVPFLRSLKK